MLINANKHTPMLSDMLLSRDSFGVPRPSDSDFLRSLLHHFQSGWALKWASFTWRRIKTCSGSLSFVDARQAAVYKPGCLKLNSSDMMAQD